MTTARYNQQSRRYVCFAVGGLWMLLLSLVAVSCFGLLLRLLLHSAWLWNVFFCLLYGVAARTLHRRLSSEYSTRKARILRLKTLPAQPHPHQKILCWIELVETDEEEDAPEEQHECSTARNNSGTVEQAVSLVVKDAKAPKEEETIQDIVAWSRDHPCILAAPEENLKIGDLLEVHLIEGDSSRPFHRPFLINAQARMKWWTLKSLTYCMLCLVALYFTFGGLPLFAASSRDLEDSMNGSWGIESCRIPPYVAVAYDLLILLQMLVMVIVPLSVYSKTKKLWGMEEPPAESYQLLRGDEDEVNE